MGSHGCRRSWILRVVRIVGLRIALGYLIMTIGQVYGRGGQVGTEHSPEGAQIIRPMRVVDKDSILYDAHPVDEKVPIPPPVIRFLPPKPVEDGVMEMQVEVTSAEAFKKDPLAGLVGGYVKYEPINPHGNSPLVRVHDLLVFPRYRRQRLALTMVNELYLMYPNATIQAHFTPNPKKPQDRHGMWKVLARLALQGYPASDEEESSEDPSYESVDGELLEKEYHRREKQKLLGLYNSDEQNEQNKQNKHQDSDSESCDKQSSMRRRDLRKLRSRSRQMAKMTVEVRLPNKTLKVKDVNPLFASFLLPTFDAMRHVERISVSRDSPNTVPLPDPKSARNVVEYKEKNLWATRYDPTEMGNVAIPKSLPGLYVNRKEVAIMYRHLTKSWRKMDFRIRDPSSKGYIPIPGLKRKADAYSMENRFSKLKPKGRFDGRSSRASGRYTVSTMSSSDSKTEELRENYKAGQWY